MARNQKLTGVLEGRTITGVERREDGVQLHFNDGATMTVKAAGPASSKAVGRTVRAVRQRDTRLSLDFEDGGTLEIITAEPTSSVMVRDKDHRMEYAD